MTDPDPHSSGAPLAVERYRELFEQSPTAMAVFDSSGRCRLVNRAMQPLLGHQAGEIEKPGLALTDLVGSDDQARALLDELETRRVIHRRQIELRDADGQLYPGMVSGRRLDWPGGPHFELSFADLTRERLLERGIRRDLARLASLTDNLPDGLLLVDPSGLTWRINPALSALLELDPSQVIGAPGDRVLQRLAGLASDPEAARKTFRQCLVSLTGSPRIHLSLSGRRMRLQLTFFPVEETPGTAAGWGLLAHISPGLSRQAHRPSGGQKELAAFRAGALPQPGSMLILAPTRRLRQTSHRTLAGAGYQVRAEADLSASIRRLQQTEFDLVVVEWPDQDAEGLRWVRAISRQTAAPILVLVPGGAQPGLQAAIDAGADDYLSLPFQPHELVARAQFTSRQTLLPPGLTPSTRLEFDGLAIDLGLRQVQRAGRLIALTPTEFDLLTFLAQHRNQVLSHEQLLARIWPGAASRQKLFTHINRLRAKLENDPSHPRYVVTRWGLGYVFLPG